MECTAARALIPGYLDDELSQSQASPLRQHLMDCASCRGIAQEAKALQSWFVPAPAQAVPPGFAERVARRAFAGDRGQATWVPTQGRRAEGELRSFVLGLTALAAGILFFFSLSIGTSRRPQTDELWADDVSRERVLERLDELNRAEESRVVPPVEPSEPAAEDAVPPGQ